MRAAIAYHKIDYVPGCAEKGDSDPTSTSIAFYPCDEQDLLPQAELSNTFRRFAADFKARRDPKWSGQFMPYEIRSVRAFTDLGDAASAEELLRYLLGCRRPPAWNHWVELYVSEARKGTYIGDMPHTWIGSSYISVVRNLIVREGDRLGCSCSRNAGRGGAKGRYSRGELPTEFGRLDLHAQMTGNVLEVNLGGNRESAGGFTLFLPRQDAPISVESGGCKFERLGSTLLFREMPSMIPHHVARNKLKKVVVILTLNPERIPFFFRAR